ncbi:MAG: phosphoenolpyruvate--protein phosphotransferase [Actinomycetaceae bacterium]|nr:phosphoenolpyruvate--protein phosphotransferase [Arcanobacterium sp.]MDD7687283.1 phosphoenolpyruvate--protein phosphotransferase [Actinomycetaceae bacterium]MDY5273561.1 phosphoenolpyruvate--protein phosphotransferase [Arcanobacterium sp.]
MQEYEIQGLGVSAGSVYGPAVIVHTSIDVDIHEPRSTDAAADTERIKKAMKAVSEALALQAAGTAGTMSEILLAQSSLARDRGLRKTIVQKIEKGSGLTHAVREAVEEYAAQLTALGGYMSERAADLRDIGDRIIAHLRGIPAPGIPALEQPSVIIAQDLSPAQTAMLRPELVRGIITVAGGATSHTAILAAQLGIAAVVGAKGAMDIPPHATVGLDGGSGIVWVHPSEKICADLDKKARIRAQLLANSGGAGSTKDGHPVVLLANIGTVSDAELISGKGVEGSGLFRSEFLFLDRADAPSFEEQTETYAAVLRAFGNRRVVVRTLDAGADKPLAFATQEKEENPALGRRGLRLSMVREDLIDTQLRALAAAQNMTGGNLWVMAPMVSTAAEAQWFADKARGYGLKRVGMMIEVPAAAIRAQQLMKYVDFASIGTNDLTQYTMAADRLNSAVTELNSYWHGAVLDMVKAACDGAHANGKYIGVCGEAAGDPLMALVLVGLGVGSLSMAAPKVPAVRFSLSRHNFAQCGAIAQAALSAVTAEEAYEAVRALVNPDVLEIS